MNDFIWDLYPRHLDDSREEAGTLKPVILYGSFHEIRSTYRPYDEVMLKRTISFGPWSSRALSMSRELEMRCTCQMNPWY